MRAAICTAEPKRSSPSSTDSSACLYRSPINGVTSGTFTIPIVGHDFSGFTRYRITLTVTDSSGLTATSTVTVFPQKVNITLASSPTGLSILLDGIPHTAPFVYDTLVGFHHTLEARNQALGTTNYNFGSWSDGGAAQHVITVPSANQTYTATFTVATTPPPPPAFVQLATATPQTPQGSVSTVFTNAQTLGNL